MSNAKKNTILIVDDEPFVIQALTTILSSDYTLYVVKDGREAIEKAEKILPELILLDIIMPEMDGYDVIAALKASEKTRNIPVLFITGLNDAAAEEKGLKLGAADYITKPFIPEIVRLRVKNQITLIEQMRLIIEKEIAERTILARMEVLLDLNHEMLTPMNAIIGMTQIARSSQDQKQTSDCLNEIHIASQQLMKLIHTFLSSRQLG